MIERIDMTEQDAQDAQWKHGCIVARLDHGPNNSPVTIMTGLSEPQARRLAADLARKSPGQVFGIFKLASIIEYIPV